MKFKIFTISVLTLLLSGQVALNGTSQSEFRNHDSPLISNDSLNVLRATSKRLLKKVYLNQDTLQQLTKYLVKKKKPTVIEKEVIKYVKVYKTIPIYVPAKDSLAYMDTFASKDTLSDDYYFDAGKAEHRSWLYRLLHHKKKK